MKTHLRVYLGIQKGIQEDDRKQGDWILTQSNLNELKKKKKREVDGAQFKLFL